MQRICIEPLKRNSDQMGLCFYTFYQNDQHLWLGVHQIWKEEAMADRSEVTAQQGLWNEQWGITALQKQKSLQEHPENREMCGREGAVTVCSHFYLQGLCSLHSKIHRRHCMMWDTCAQAVLICSPWTEREGGVAAGETLSSGHSQTQRYSIFWTVCS